MLFMRDTSMSFPELWLNIYVSGPPMDAAGFPEMFSRVRCFKANTPEEADLVVFTGGPDVEPSLYTNAKPHASVYVDAERDKADLDLYVKCYDQGIPMMGVCRGAQFGHVMNGGELYMDVDNHNEPHFMFTGKETLTASSVHHQMCIQNKGMDVLAWAHKSTKRYISATMHESGQHANHKDIEAFFYRDACFFGVQGHPEYKGFLSYTHWCMSQLESLIMHNPDVVLDKSAGVYRLSEDFRKMRDSNTFEIKETA